MQQATVGKVLHLLGDDIEVLGLSHYHLRHLRALRECRTQKLGGHIDKCNNAHCGRLHISYNSCRNRHCPQCQGHKREAWMQARSQELLPVPYFHIVFTLPSELNGAAMHNPTLVYKILFDSAWQTLQKFFAGQGVQGGMVSILHTWGQQLSLHPHLHCIVPAGGVTQGGGWKHMPYNQKYLFSVRALSKVFRAKYLTALKQSQVVPQVLINELFAKDWVVYAKRPFGSVSSVIEYLGRYTHKVAISNHRIQKVENGIVYFEYKDYKNQGAKKLMQISLSEFIRRLAMHILPYKFVRIRHYGILSSTWKRKRLKALQKQMYGYVIEATAPTTKLHQCPRCKVGTLVTVCVFGERGPPPLGLIGNQPIACNA